MTNFNLKKEIERLHSNPNTPLLNTSLDPSVISTLKHDGILTVQDLINNPHTITDFFKSKLLKNWMQDRNL